MAGALFAGAPASPGKMAAAKVVTAATTLKAHEQIVLIMTAGTYVITLPSVVEAAGKIYSIRSRVGSSSVTVADSDEGSVDYTSNALTAIDDYVLLYSDGLCWYELKETTT